MDTRRAPKRIFDAHLPDQRAQRRLDLRSPSQWARLPPPIAAKASPMPTHQRRGPDNCENLQDRRKPAIQLDKEPAIMVREPDATMQPTPQDNQLMSQHRVLSFKPQLRLERRGQDGQNETEQPDHSTSLGDSVTSSTRMRFSAHTTSRIWFAVGTGPQKASQIASRWKNPLHRPNSSPPLPTFSTASRRPHKRRLGKATDATCGFPNSASGEKNGTEGAASKSFKKSWAQLVSVVERTR
jgi:hypothetical protein